MSSLRSTSATIAGLVWGTAVAAQDPLSAIDWLGEVVVAPPAVEAPVPAGRPERPEVSVTPLDAPRADAVGLLSPEVTGLPRGLWRASATERLIHRLDAIAVQGVPAIRALHTTLLLAEADPPPDAGSRARLLRARLAALRRLGAVEPALAMVERAGGDRPALFDAWLDLALLAGLEGDACAALAAAPHLSDDARARVYCLARAGDWPTAALILRGGEASGAITEPDGTLLAFYLAPELIDEAAPPRPPADMTPLRFRLHEAAGAPLDTRDLPREYAVADLRGNAGWKAEIEAAERLAQSGAVPASRLFGLYTARSPAASGGVWDRVAAVQALDRALARDEAAEVAAALPAARDAARKMRLETVYAEIFAERLLATSPLPEPAREAAVEMVLLSPLYERAAELRAPGTARARLLAGIAAGRPEAADAATPIEAAIADGFAATSAAPEHRPLIEAGRLGEAILAAAAQLESGVAHAAPSALRAALSTLRATGVEETARRAALQVLLLEPQR